MLMAQGLARQTKNYTGADVAAVCREAALAALEDDMEAAAVAARHYGAALTAVPPSPPPTPAIQAVYDRFSRPGR